ncbi:MAG: hypothetical protein R2845_01365 [Thermomicrobiales bacterium]
MRDQARDGWQLAMARPVVRTVLLFSLIAGLAAEAFDRLSRRVCDRPVCVSVAVRARRSDYLVRPERIVRDTARTRSLGTLPATGAGVTCRQLATLLTLCATAQVAALVVRAERQSADGVLDLLVRAIIDVVKDPVELAWLNRTSIPRRAPP